MRKSQVEEFYVVLWKSSREQLFEMPTGGVAQMQRGKNLIKLARKEQCLYLSSQFRSKFKLDTSFFRVKTGKGLFFQHLHPNDGVYPQKVVFGRRGANQNLCRIC